MHRNVKPGQSHVYISRNYRFENHVEKFIRYESLKLINSSALYIDKHTYKMSYRENNQVNKTT